MFEETKVPDYILELGGIYYEQHQFDLALKYYELAAENGSLNALTCLGYIWYYGRTGEKDFEKAFNYYDRARKMGDLIAAYKVADMYKNGYYVGKDEERYKEIIEELYSTIQARHGLYVPLPEVYTRLARIRAEEGNVQEALRLYDEAREDLSRRIQDNPFFGNLSIMKWMIADIYALRGFDRGDFSLYDLYYLLTAPIKVRFVFEGETYEVESVLEDGQISICFNERWYRAVDDFFQKACIGDELLTTLYEELCDFEVV